MEHPIYQWMIWGYPYFRKPQYIIKTPTSFCSVSKHVKKNTTLEDSWSMTCMSWRMLVLLHFQIGTGWHVCKLMQIDANCISILCCLSPFLSFTGATRPDRLIIWDEWSPEYQEHIQIFQIAKELVKQTLNLPTMPNHTSQTLPTNSTNLIAPLHWINHPELNQLTVTYPTFNYI
jgi:hypothetical protein